MCTNELYKELGRYNKVELGVFPTPLHRLRGFEKKHRHNPIWIKRDDLSGLGLGGNKVRVLEYILGDALLKDSDTILVSGPLQSNMCTLTAAASRKLGLDCITIHNSETPKELKGNLVLNSILDIKSYYIGEKSIEQRQQFMEEVAIGLVKESKIPYSIENGGSTTLGSLGYVWGAIEIYKQIIQENLNIQHIFMPAGNGGTVAGLIAGAGLLGVPFHVHVISVEHSKEKLTKIIYDFVKEIEIELNLEIAGSLELIMTIYEDYMGEGWGMGTKESEAMIYNFAQLEGFYVEDVYTSKVMVGMVDLLEKQIIPENEGVCYWHTGGLPCLFV